MQIKNRKPVIPAKIIALAEAMHEIEKATAFVVRLTRKDKRFWLMETVYDDIHNYTRTRRKNLIKEFKTYARHGIKA